MNPEPPNLPSIRPQRERTIQELCDHFARDDLELDEFERRLDLANKALTLADLAALTADLPAAGAAAPASAAPAPRAQPAGSLGRRARQLIVAIMGGARRRGRWTPAASTNVIAIMGGASLDFRDAQLEAGTTEVTIFAFWGGAEIIVPPDTDVDVGGVAIMGGFDHSSSGPQNAGPDAPRLRINGVAIMGGVDVRVRARGEAAGSAPWDYDYSRVGHGHGGHDHTGLPDSRRQLHEARRQMRDAQRQLRDEWRGHRR